ncbi:MAG: CPBP family intramembrane metalloprotease [Moorea sp. SIO2B7]|nr:CPBP family intramembrane metalloprotease [Moorena sp. SIO2B7]
MLLSIYAVIVLPIGFISHFLTFEVVDFTWFIIFRCVGITLIAPALLEELFYRVIILPHKLENSSNKAKLIWGSISLGAYILSHPLNAFTFFPAGLPTFIDPIFLLATALLGIICMTIYWQSESLWSSVIIHWLIVVVWLLFLGGYGRLHQS